MHTSYIISEELSMKIVQQKHSENFTVFTEIMTIQLQFPENHAFFHESPEKDSLPALGGAVFAWVFQNSHMRLNIIINALKDGFTPKIVLMSGMTHTYKFHVLLQRFQPLHQPCALAVIHHFIRITV